MTRFGAVEMRRPIAQLKRLREEDNFFNYVDSFVSLVSQVQLSDEDQVTMFLEGLKGNTKKLIMVLNPCNLQKAIAYANALTTEDNPYRGGGRVDEPTHGAPRMNSWSNAKQGGSVSMG